MLNKDDKVVVVSLHRTATQSTVNFLKNLGYNPHHWGGYRLGQKIVEDKNLDPQDFKHSFYNILEEYNAVADCPFNIMYEYFDKRYNSCKFILITRDFNSWVKSINKLYSIVKTDGFDLIDKMQYWEYLKFKPKDIKDCSEKDLFNMYQTHNNNIREYFYKKNNLLEIDIKDIKDGHKIASFLQKEDVFKNLNISFANIDFVNDRINKLHF